MPKSLSEILSDADARSSVGTTIRNRSDFIVICAPQDEQFARRITDVAAGVLDLTGARIANHKHGLVTISPVFGKEPLPHWCLRNQSSLGEPMAAGTTRHALLSQALETAVEWWSKQPADRQVIVARADFSQQIRKLSVSEKASPR